MNGMKDREVYSEIKAIPPIAIRIDGRNFKSTFEKLKFKKPYDEKFARAMADAAELFIRDSGLNPQFAYTFSDEVNIFFFKLSFQGRVEKLNSVIPSFFSSALTLKLGLKIPIAFDSRVIPLHRNDLLNYLDWRQAEAWRNFVNSYGYYKLIEDGLSKSEAVKRLKGMSASDIHDMLFKRGLNLNAMPIWQKRGILIKRESFEKIGYNPLEKKRVKAVRMRIVQDWAPPIFNSKEGRKLIESLIPK